MASQRRTSPSTEPPATAAPPDLQLGDLIGYRIRKLNTLLTQHSKELSSGTLGLSLAQSRVLYELGFGGPAKPAQIAKSGGLERSHVTQATHALVERLLVSKMADPEDGRGVLLSITPKGQALLSRGLEASVARRQLLESALTDEELRIFNEALTKLTGVAELLAKEPVSARAQRQAPVRQGRPSKKTG